MEGRRARGVGGGGWGKGAVNLSSDHRWNITPGSAARGLVGLGPQVVDDLLFLVRDRKGVLCQSHVRWTVGTTALWDTDFLTLCPGHASERLSRTGSKRGREGFYVCKRLMDTRGRE